MSWVSEDICGRQRSWLEALGVFLTLGLTSINFNQNGITTVTSFKNGRF